VRWIHRGPVRAKSGEQPHFERHRSPKRIRRRENGGCIDRSEATRSAIDWRPEHWVHVWNVWKAHVGRTYLCFLANSAQKAGAKGELAVKERTKQLVDASGAGGHGDRVRDCFVRGRSRTNAIT